jgi:hypothetical protein
LYRSRAWHGVPFFYFHLHNDVDARDEEGKDLPNLDAARQLAIHQARFTLAETIKDSARVNLGHRIDIEDEQGNVLATVHFREALTITG